ncbi:U2-type spliceosomal complex subunit CWC21 NDAI_0C05270 [Naumovozyma dairenensis CBS 421]|uniref:Pre-mRNA-splicing factor CWC21 n=1 Tax=Naumovozyma dairenensis (strain ATCC 10597 / BCRC 20456 / CBS 421 / NBRC 0211 / NRRL Y-12639) TaxID=1071378 RepID=G0W8S5_NAUDC|nr:hypothetical protein NDAI_0C05270 [Naumovozyma dairenensis CBS 421]CCD24186.1 hypothetical protein NDAI_0C05270 [Naumovozyma dairenensis CBS 421]
MKRKNCNVLALFSIRNKYSGTYTSFYIPRSVMSYNGIGLKSAKGSSTSGHIQRSLAHNNNNRRRNENQNQITKNTRNQGPTTTRPNRIKTIDKIIKLDNLEQQHISKLAAPKQQRYSVLSHLNKRKIELQVSELRDKLEDDDPNLPKDVIVEKCNKLRIELIKEQEISDRLKNVYTSRKDRNSSSPDSTTQISK